MDNVNSNALSRLSFPHSDNLSIKCGGAVGNKFRPLGEYPV